MIKDRYFSKGQYIILLMYKYTVIMYTLINQYYNLNLDTKLYLLKNLKL